MYIHVTIIANNWEQNLPLFLMVDTGMDDPNSPFKSIKDALKDENLQASIAQVKKPVIHCIDLCSYIII